MARMAKVKGIEVVQGEVVDGAAAEPVVVQAEAVEETRRYSLVPLSDWRERKVRFGDLSKKDQLEYLRDVTYNMALQGASLSDIADYFAFTDMNTVKRELGEAHKMGKAELKLLLKADQINYALNSKQPIGKIWAGKQFADQADTGSTDQSYGTGGEGNVNLQISVISAATQPSTDA